MKMSLDTIVLMIVSPSPSPRLSPTPSLGPSPSLSLKVLLYDFSLLCGLESDIQHSTNRPTVGDITIFDYVSHRECATKSDYFSIA